MTSQIDHEKVARSKSERGAALLSVLMTSAMLMAAGGALILATSMATRTAVDSTAEMQAYYSAEAGLQTTLNVLRGNVSPNAAMPSGTKINFFNAINVSTSNLPSDSTGTPRLSGWLNYDYTPSEVTTPDRVTLTSSYAPASGLAYSVAVSDPDSTPSPGEPARRLHLQPGRQGQGGGGVRAQLAQPPNLGGGASGGGRRLLRAPGRDRPGLQLLAGGPHPRAEPHRHSAGPARLAGKRRRSHACGDRGGRQGPDQGPLHQREGDEGPAGLRCDLARLVGGRSDSGSAFPGHA